MLKHIFIYINLSDMLDLRRYLIYPRQVTFISTLLKIKNAFIGIDSSIKNL